jgi:hypothetical protein
MAYRDGYDDHNHSDNGHRSDRRRSQRRTERSMANSEHVGFYISGQPRILPELVETTFMRGPYPPVSSTVESGRTHPKFAPYPSPGRYRRSSYERESFTQSLSPSSNFRPGNQRKRSFDRIEGSYYQHTTSKILGNEYLTSPITSARTFSAVQSTPPSRPQKTDHQYITLED